MEMHPSFKFGGGEGNMDNSPVFDINTLRAFVKLCEREKNSLNGRIRDELATVSSRLEKCTSDDISLLVAQMTGWYAVSTVSLWA